mgnify:CR=1 FL=1
MARFNKEKFKKGLLKINDRVEWAKDFVSIFNIRKIIIYLIIASLFAGYWYWKGKQDTPVEIGEDLVAYDKEFTLRLDKTQLAKLEDPALKKPKNSRLLYYYDWRKDILGDAIKAEDMEELRKKLKPYGFMSHLLFVEGIGSGINNVGLEAGLGIRYARLWQIRGDVIGTNRGGYLGLSYKPKWKFIPNSSVGFGLGKGYKGEDRGLIYFSVEL